jgi:hypothetical protein
MEDPDGKSSHATAAPNGIVYCVKLALMTKTPIDPNARDHYCRENIRFLVLKRVC